MGRLDGQRALVTGASSGIGAVDAVELPLLSPYVAAKHGLHGFLNSLRADLRAGGSHVRVAEVRPGAVDTRLLGLAERYARPLTERALALAGRLARDRAHADATPHGLWEPSGEGELGGHLHGRPSLLAALQLRGTRPRGGVGPR
ncbi:MAG: SDR family NAD(P)-dependent oxidoreductase [Actinobacteria bacterium]|nr:SDR family NAD(P)-dependent oxidoreductase [Actinomycetota bacterium]